METKNYLNMGEFTKRVYNVYKNVLSEYGNELTEHVNDLYETDDFALLCAENLAEVANRDMCNYLHAETQRIPGNFRNARYDLDENLAKSSRMFDQMVARLDAGYSDQETENYRTWPTNWYFDAFGTCGIAYNFQEELNEYAYELEEEEA